MAVVQFAGFEGGISTLDQCTITSTTYTSYSTTQARTGARSLRCNPISGVGGGFYFAGTTHYYAHFGLYVATLPSVTRVIFGTVVAGGVNVRLTSAGALALYINTTLMGTSSAAFASPGWHWVGIRQVTGTSVTFLQIDDVGEVTGTGTVSSVSAQFGFTGTEASAADIYIDDAITENAAFLTSSKVGLLLPISDSARSTTWTDGIGGTTNLYDAVNNTPPIGKATETATSQIEHVGGAFGYYDANMTSYTTAGVGSGDTLIALRGIIVWGEDSGTGTKLLGYEGVWNPLWTGELGIDVSTGHGSGATLDYSTGTDYWNERRSAIVQNPTLLQGFSTSPIMRVDRNETASRIASVCFMGMEIVWTQVVAGAGGDPFPYVGGGYYG